MSSQTRRAEVLRRKDTLADLLEEVRDYVDMTPEDRDRCLQDVSQLAAQILRDRGDSRAVLERRDPMPESSSRIWQRLMRRYRSGRATV